MTTPGRRLSGGAELGVSANQRPGAGGPVRFGEALGKREDLPVLGKLGDLFGKRKDGVLCP